MKITDETWQIHCEDIAHKQELYDYAVSRGVPTHSNKRIDTRNDEDLILAFWLDGLWAGYSSNPGDSVINESHFKAMCDAYAQEQQPEEIVPHPDSEIE